jgi:hypothetical protein
MTYELTEASFLKDVATHEMQQLRDDGVYRHLRFKRPDTTCMYFDLVTWPGVLCYTGDMGTFVFTRLRDMFEFFRTDREYAQRRGDRQLFVNHGYWSEKLVAVDGQRHSGSAMEFSEALLRAYVNETRLGWIREARASGSLSRDERRDLWEEVDHEVLDRLDDDGEQAAYLALRDFRWRPSRPTRAPEFEFTDFWDHEFRQYTHAFQWCCFALDWGIEQYDRAKEVAL